MTRDAMRALVERHVEAENRRDLAGAMATYADACFYDSVALGLRFEGRDAVAAQYAALFAAMPDGALTIEGEAFGDGVLVNWGTFNATVTGEFMGLPPTGRRIALPTVAFYMFRDGLMAGERLVFDLATLCDQAGVSLSAVRAAASGLAAALEVRASA